jgi:FkbM family methyltransferase
VNSVYLLVYRTYLALKSSVIDHGLRRWPAARQGFDATKRFIKRRFFPSRVLWLQVQSGFAKGMWMHLRIPDEAGFWRGEHEPEVQTTLSAIVRPADVVYDVGAHVGSMALGAARLVGAVGKVVAFDGDPGNVLRLRENSARNGLDARLQIVHAAVWSHASAGGISFRQARDGTSQGGVEAEGQRPVLADGEIIRVPAITLDDFVAAGGPLPHVIKIDVEGGEFEVLRGAANLLRMQRPFLIVEVHHQRVDRQIRALLEEFHYTAEWRIPKENFPRSLTACPAERGLWPRSAPEGGG